MTLKTTKTLWASVLLLGLFAGTANAQNRYKFTSPGAAAVEALNSAQIATTLLLFGGEGHRTFLGCLNCNRFDDGSVCNKFGTFGNKFQTDSIWNKFGTYGNQFSNYSPWNKFASEPPIIVDRDGGSYGYFTANRTAASRTRIAGFLFLLDRPDFVTGDMDGARDLFCE